MRNAPLGVGERCILHGGCVGCTAEACSGAFLLCARRDVPLRGVSGAFLLCFRRDVPLGVG